MDHETFRAEAHRLVDWMADYLATVEQRPVRAQTAPGDVLAQVPSHPPAHGEPMSEIFADFESIVLPAMTHWQHPRFFAYFSANSSPPSVLAEMLTATMAAQCMLWETSPAANELETRMMEWLRELIGLPSTFAGTIQDSASTATLCALVAARERASGDRAAREGHTGRMLVYQSTEAHSSIEKGARVAGFGSANVRKIATDATGAMLPGALRQAIAADRADGAVPTCVVACIGATGLGSVDPLREIAAICREERVFLHVDAAWAGSALILEEYRHWLAGIEDVDSFVFNPHKWLFTNFDCSAHYLRDPAELTRALAMTPAYLASPSGEAMPEYRDWSIALGRRFRALKLWFVLRSYGSERLAGLIRAHIDHAAWFEQQVLAHPDFERVTPRVLSLVVFRWRPAGQEEGAVDLLNERLVRALNDDGRIYLTRTTVAGRPVIRFVVGQTTTERRHVEQGWRVIEEVAARLVTAGAAQR
jgi:aromatic-L-amino-acid/L-tryptophan decarboxylase